MGIFNFISEFSGFSGNAAAIDLGTCNTLIAVHGTGLVLNEATAVAVSADDSRVVLAVGNEALEMSGRTPSGLVLRYPFRDGVIADYALAEYMIHDFFKRAIHRAGHIYSSPRVLLCVPECVTEVERRAVCEAVRHAGARDVIAAEEIMAACVGSGLPYSEPTGSMVVDIGGGTSDAAVIVLGGIAVSKSIRMGGNSIDRDIINFIRRKHDVIIGAATAERIKKAMTNERNVSHEVSGLCLKTGLPRRISVSNEELREAVAGSISNITELVTDVLALTPPELASDIIKNGITLCGGGAYLCGLSESISGATGVEVKISQNPLECVALGALEMLNNMRRGKTVINAGVEQTAE